MRSVASRGARSRNCETMIRYSAPLRCVIQIRLLRHIAHALLVSHRSLWIDFPSNKIEPALIAMSPVIILIVVDLPEPFGPR